MSPHDTVSWDVHVLCVALPTVAVKVYLYKVEVNLIVFFKSDI